MIGRTRRVSRCASLGAATAFAVLAAACGGGADGSLFGGDPNGAAAPGPQNGDGTFHDGPTSTTAACVTHAESATLAPADLVFMYDRSGSMGDPSEGFDPALKWTPVASGMHAFFTDPASSSMRASLQFFPLGADRTAACGADYATPAVPLTPIADGAASLDGAIAATSPAGGTPTLPALAGAFAYARTVPKEHASDRTAVVLVTDGEPGYRVSGQNVTGCPDNDVPHVAAAAQAAFAGSPSIPTYVIGVGPSLDKLNQVAAAGGTKSAFMVSVDDPAQTAARFREALDAIRAEALTCSLALPAPPAGEELNVDAVNVGFTSGAGVETILTYDAGCARGDGWRYDDVAHPTHVELCAKACDTARADRGGKLTIAFGCVTKGQVN